MKMAHDDAACFFVQELCAPDEVFEVAQVATGTLVTSAAAATLQAEQPPVRVEGYVERTVPGYRDDEFRRHFRMQRSETANTRDKYIMLF